jgi:transposase
MGGKHKHYTKEFKVEAVRLVVEEGRCISEVSIELGISQGLLHHWKQK